jgi:hypothetical protein
MKLRNSKFGGGLEVGIMETSSIQENKVAVLPSFSLIPLQTIGQLI